MLGGNDFITVWNRLNNGRFIRHEVNVKCRYTHKTTASHSGAGRGMASNIESVTICRIPYTKGFVMPEIWTEMSAEEQKDHWTLQADDFLALGVHKYEIGTDEVLEEISVPKLRKKLQSNVMEVKAVRYSIHTQLGKHIRAEGV